MELVREVAVLVRVESLVMDEKEVIAEMLSTVRVKVRGGSVVVIVESEEVGEVLQTAKIATEGILPLAQIDLKAAMPPCWSDSEQAVEMQQPKSVTTILLQMQLGSEKPQPLAEMDVSKQDF